MMPNHRNDGMSQCWTQFAIRRVAGRFLGAAIFIVLIGSPLDAGLITVDLFKNISYNQTSAAAPTAPIRVPFCAYENFFQNPGDFDSATVTYPGTGSPQALSLAAAGEYLFQTPFFASQAAMDSAYPFGNYVLSAHNSGTSANQSATISYAADEYGESAVPAYSPQRRLQPFKA